MSIDINKLIHTLEDNLYWIVKGSADYNDKYNSIKALRQQQAEIEQLKKDNEWIGVDNALPNNSGFVLVYWPYIPSRKMILKFDFNSKSFKNRNTDHTWQVEKWKPLPEPPEDKS